MATSIRRAAVPLALLSFSCGGSAGGPEDEPNQPIGGTSSGGAENVGTGGATGGTDAGSGGGDGTGSSGGAPPGSGGVAAAGGTGGAAVVLIPEDVIVATDNGIHCTIVDAETVCWGTTLDGVTTHPVLENVVSLSSDFRIRALTAEGDVYAYDQEYEPPAWNFIVGGVSQLADDAMFLTGDGTVKDGLGELYELPLGVEGVVDAAMAESVDCYLNASDQSIVCPANYPNASNCEAGTALLDVPEGRFVSIDAGAAHFCALAEDQSIVCWGAGSGMNDAPVEPDGSCPVALTMVHQGQNQAPPGTYTFVSAGPLHTCAVRTDTTVVCWGAGTTDDDCTDPWNSCGQSMPPAETGFVQVSTGFRNSCGLKTDGTVVCWGSDAGGRSTPPPELQP